MQGLLAVTQRSSFDNLPRRRRNPIRMYISNRFYEWRWIVWSRMDRLRGRDPLDRHRRRGGIIGLTGFGNPPPLPGHLPPIRSPTDTMRNGAGEVRVDGGPGSRPPAPLLFAIESAAAKSTIRARSKYPESSFSFRRECGLGQPTPPPRPRPEGRRSRTSRPVGPVRSTRMSQPARP